MISNTDTYCDEHKNDDYKQYNKARYQNDKEYVQLYSSSRWKKLRYQKLLDAEFLCEICKANGIFKEGNTAHHLIEVKDDWSKRFDWDNLQVVCKQCHNKLHRR